MERRIAVVLMASGYSERFGSNKLLEPFGNRCLFTYAVDLAYASDAAMKIIVTRYEPIKHYVKENAPKMDIVWNAHPERGIHSFGNSSFETVKRLRKICRLLLYGL